MGVELDRAREQVWNPKVIAKMWTYYLLKGQSAGVVPTPAKGGKSRRKGAKAQRKF